jgi:hypothetical protein
VDDKHTSQCSCPSTLDAIFQDSACFVSADAMKIDAFFGWRLSSTEGEELRIARARGRCAVWLIGVGPSKSLRWNRLHSLRRRSRFSLRRLRTGGALRDWFRVADEIGK